MVTLRAGLGECPTLSNEEFGNIFFFGVFMWVSDEKYY